MATERAPTGSTEILLVEDNPGDVRLVEELLDEATIRTGTATGPEQQGAATVRHADRLATGLGVLDDEPIDVVLLDLGLPDSTGLATLEAVLDRDPDVPTVVLTGLDDETVGVRAVALGAQEYLTKDELTPTLLGRSVRHAIERKKLERTQTALHAASRDLIQAESKTEVSRLVVDAAADVLDVPAIAIYLFDDSANVLRPVAATDYVESLFAELPTFGPDDTAVTWRAFVTGETISHDDVDEAESVHRRDTPLRSGIWIPLGDLGVVAILSADGGGFDRRTSRLADHLAVTAETALTRVEREERLRESEDELTARNRRLTELNRMNGIIREIDQVLVRTTTRDEIERSVCDLLTGEERFAFAWIGERVDEGTVRPRTWAGSGQNYLDAVTLSTERDDGPPAVRAVTTGAVTRTSNVATDLRKGPWRKDALARGLQSALGVPLAYGELSYGVLTVFASEPNGFGARSTEMFAELGETIANAMNAVETRRALLTDTVVELELAMPASEDVFGRLAREADCRIEYGGTVPHADGTTRVFFEASDASADALHAVAEEVPSVRSLERIGEDDDGSGEHRFEATVAGPTIPATLVECGAVARSVEVSPSGARAVVELPAATDVRTFVERLEGPYPDTELLARRDRERSADSRRSFEATLESRLTDRQLEVLRTAYLSGYFEWPRERTGEEVADSLGITQPTFNGHLRTAERELCALLFEGVTPAGREDQHT